MLEVILGAIVFALPFFVGKAFRSKSFSLTYLSGQLLLWAAFQLAAVPAVYYRAEFSTLFWIYTGIVVALTGFGVYSWIHSRQSSRTVVQKRRRRKQWFRRLSPFLLIALVIICYQMCVYIFKMHLDEDDARWIAEANDALVKNKMLLHNPATGEYIGRFVGEMVKDVFSPWSMYLAWLSRMTTIRAVVIAHTVYPPILLGLSYCAYYEIGSQLFTKKHERGIFLLMVSVINLFMAGNVYTQSVFTLTRIWQGKAVVAAVMIPSIMMAILRIQGEDRKKRDGSGTSNRSNKIRVADWLLLFITGAACCLFSGMGIAIGLIMIFVYGAYVVVKGLIANPRIGWKQIPLWFASMGPSILFGLGYLAMK